jgi:hypothetical protein
VDWHRFDADGDPNPNLDRHQTGNADLDPGRHQNKGDHNTDFEHLPNT